MPGPSEYKLEALNVDLDELSEYLNEQSSDGWELVTVLDGAGEDGHRSVYRLVFRRDLANPTWDQPTA